MALYRALRDKLDPQGLEIQYDARNSLGPVLINPNASVSSPDIELDVKRRTHEHFLRSASSLEVGEARWFFTGRTSVLTRIATWLRSGTGMFVVTGPPGSGKSAIVGRVALLADPAGRAMVIERDPEFDPESPANPQLESITVAVHAKEKRVEQVRVEIAGALGSLALVESTEDLLELLARRERPVTILLDALDEAKGGDSLAIAEMLAALVAGGHRALVATRPDHARRVGLPGRGRGALLRALKRPDPDVDLADDPTSGQADVADYIARRLADGTEANRYPPGDARALSEALGPRLGANFLFARLSVQRLLAEAPLTLEGDWLACLPVIATYEAFGRHVEADLGRITDPDRRRIVRELLMALAFVEGAGAPRQRIWPALARAITGRSYSDDDIQAVLDEAAWYLVESTDGQQTVYRLFHEELIRYFRETATNEH